MKRAVAIAALTVVIAGCSREKPAVAAKPRADVLATVGSVEITIADFAERAAERHSPDTTAAREALLAEMTAEETLVQAARSAGLDKTPAYRRALREFLVTRLREEKLQPLLAAAEIVSNESLAAAMPEAAARYAQPAARRYAWLLVADEPGARDRLADSLATFRNLPPDPSRNGFGTIAAEVSEDGDTRYQGGDLGWLSDAQLAARFTPETAAAARALTPGGVTGIFPVESGIAVLTLSAARPGQALPPPAARERLRYELIQKQRTQATADFERAARAAVRVEIHPENLASLPPPAG